MKRVVSILAVLVLASLSCVIPAVQTTESVPTQTVSPTVFPSATASPTPLIILQTNTSTPTDTPVPTPSFTPTPLSPMFTVNIDSNCRSGPSKAYPIMGYILEGESVQILGQTTPDRILWWYVQNKDIRCWVSGSLGTTSGNLAAIPMIVAPPIPTPVRETVDVLFENNTGKNICELVFYDDVDVLFRFKWNKGEWKGDGSDQTVNIYVGGYDLVEAFDCKGQLTASLVNIVANSDNDAYPIPYIP